MLAKYYCDIYLWIIMLLTLYQYSRYSRMKISRLNVRILGSGLVRPESGSTVLILLFFILFIGLRPTSGVFVDMMNYYGFYTVLSGSTFHFNLNAENKIWDNLFEWWACNDLGFTSFMLFVSTVYFGCAYWACRRLFPKDVFASFLVFLAAFSTFSYGTNGVKAGAAASIFLVALSYYKKWKISIPLVLLSYGFHHSMIMPVAAYVVAIFYKKTNVYLVAWLLCSFISAAHITWFQELFAQMSSDDGDESGADYLNSVESDWGGSNGFRIDFVIYSAMPVVVAYYVSIRKKIKSDLYSFLINVYLITNSIWMLCMYASFTNRIAYLSWAIYPIVLIYPYLKEKCSSNQYKVFAKVMLMHLCFTMAMHYIYYS